MATASKEPKPVRDLLGPLGTRIQYLRENAGMSQNDLAEKAGYQWGTISSIETARHKPNLRTLVFIARALNVDMVELFVFDELPAHDTEKRRALRKLMQLVRDCEPWVIHTVTQQARVLVRRLGGGARGGG